MRFYPSLTAFLLPLLAFSLSTAAEIPRPEHPRPDFRRDQWLNLNGTWSFAFDPENRGVTQGWFEPGRGGFDQQIVVPFPWESRLSGIADRNYKGVAWYRRSFRLPKDWRDAHVWLCFGAVDWKATVWVNGERVGCHEGGYTPFRFDITKLLKTDAENTVVVRAEDWTSREQPVGKQVGWYTKTSGIWQTVYLEAVPSQIAIQQVHVVPSVNPAKATFDVLVVNPGHRKTKVRVLVRFDSGNVPSAERKVTLQPGENRVRLEARIPKPRLWYPEDPFLYAFTVVLSGKVDTLDRVHSYFGLREVKIAPAPGSGYPMIWINDRPVYIRGALNQAFNPDGIYTYPSDDYAREDVERGQKVGFNMYRIHIKADEPRFLYWADRLGMLLQCDMPCFLDYTDSAKVRWENTTREIIARDFNHPSIFSWCLFNETWGLNHPGAYTEDRQEWVRQMVHEVKRLDPTRLVEDNSPCNLDHVETDLNTWHFYINDYARARRHIQQVVDKTFPGSSWNFVGGNKQDKQPLLNSEYGGISAGSGDRDISWCFKFLTNELRLYPKIVGYVYTEYQDIEWEHNGFYDYDREAKDFGYDRVWPGFEVQDLNRADFLAVDSPPCPTVAPGATWKAEVRASCQSGLLPRSAVLKWDLLFTDRFGGSRNLPGGERAVVINPFDVTGLGQVHVTLPGEPGLATVRVRVEDAEGRLWARNYVNLDVYADSVSSQEQLTDNWLAVRFKPGDTVEARWDSLVSPAEAKGQKVAGLGCGFFVYHVRLPSAVREQDVSEIRLLFEGAARAGLAKVDARFPGAVWSRKKPTDYPQTDATKWPSDVTVWISGVPVETVPFPDDPADARGVLSHRAGIDPGSYGYLTTVRLAGQKLADALKHAREKGFLCVRFEVAKDAVHRGGFSLYGDRLGGYPVAPTLFFKLADKGGK